MMAAHNAPWSNRTLLTAIGVTLLLVLLADQIGYIGGRIPYVFLILWFGSATIVAVVFVPEARDLEEQPEARAGWRDRLFSAGAALVPLALVPLLEIRRTGHDPMIWLMEIALLISICSTPFFSIISRRVLSAAVLTWGAATILMLPCATLLFQVIEHAEMAKDAPTVDTVNTMHAFFAPGYRYLFYLLASGIVFLYCPFMLFLSYRTFSRRSDYTTTMRTTSMQ